MSKTPDYSQAWVRGWEEVFQEGTNFFREMREKRGWTREQVWEMADELPPTRQAVFEWDDHAGFPELHELIALAIVYDTSPGALLDRCFTQKGEQIEYAG